MTEPTVKPTVNLFDPTLAMAADIVTDLEDMRKANENRLRQMTRTEPDEDGITRGLGLDEGHPDVAVLKGLVLGAADLENDAIKHLQKVMRRHPLGPWAKGIRGAGDKQVGRLLGVIGDPYWSMLLGGPRTVSKLWAYCGMHTVEDLDGHRVAARRRKGVKSNWSTEGKTRVYLIIKSCIRQLDRGCKQAGEDAETVIVRHAERCSCSPYRIVYDARKAHTAVTHGPDTEDPWTPGRRDADAIRVAGKAFLKDLWIEGRRLHGEAEI